MTVTNVIGTPADVPFLDLRDPYLELSAELQDAVQRVLQRGWYIAGDELAHFEAAYADYCGVEHCVGVSNGLDALQLVLRAWDLRAGDEVIVPSHTFIATWLAVTYAGGRPVPVDVDASTYNLDPSRVEDAISPRTRAIVPVHLYGQCADMNALREIAARRGLRLLEDAAQAQGACVDDRSAGSLGDAAAFSFYPAKNLGALGDAGAVTTRDRSVAERVRRLANYGSTEKYAHAEKGMNCRLDELQAALLSVKLRSLDEWNERRRHVAERYMAALAASDTDIIAPSVPAWATPVWHQFVIRTRDRDAVRGRLARGGIQSMVHYPVPPHLQPAYSELGYTPGAFPVAEQLASEVVSLPIGPHLSDPQVTRVLEVLLDG